MKSVSGVHPKARCVLSARGLHRELNPTVGKRHILRAMRTLAVTVLAAVVPALAVSRVRAENDEADQTARPLVIEVGGIVTLGLGDVSQQMSDTVGTQPGQEAAGLVAYGGWGLAKRWTIAVAGSFQWAASSSLPEKQERLLWLVTEARFFPGRFARLHLAADLGVAQYRETIPRGYFASTGEAVVQWAPAIGVVLGWHLLRSGPVLVGLDLRCLVTVFGSSPPTFPGLPDSYAKDFGTVPWFSLGLNLGLQP